MLSKRKTIFIPFAVISVVAITALEGYFFWKLSRKEADPNASLSFPESVRFVSEDGNISFDTRFADHALPEEGPIALTEWFASGAGIINDLNGEKVACRFQKTPYNRCTCTVMEIRDGYVYPNDYAVWFEAENRSLNYHEEKGEWDFVCDPLGFFPMAHWKDEVLYEKDTHKDHLPAEEIVFHGRVIEAKPF